MRDWPGETHVRAEEDAARWGRGGEYVVSQK